MVTLCMEVSAQNMEETIMKNQDTTWIIKTFKSEFQLVAMEENLITSLFNVTLNIEKHNEIEIEIDPTKATLTIIE